MMSAAGKNVYIVHCVDTEGPLYESLEATFDRLKSVLNIALPPKRETLIKIQHGELDLGGKEDVARTLVSEEMLGYLEHWGAIDGMLDELLSEKFRGEYTDGIGHGWIFNWFIMDHIGYDVNPRHRDVGYLNIFDHYHAKLNEKGCATDEVGWHFHPMSTYREGHVCATSLLRSPHAIEGLCRRVIDRKWFPASFRAGYHTIRPDIHWFLEQYIPFDFSNQSQTPTAMDRAQPDVSGSRFGDWRLAPSDWSSYHPAHDNYQLPGNCRRSVFRCLNVGTRMRLLTQSELDSAFARANRGCPTIVAFADHDWRDMRKDVKQVHAQLRSASEQYPEVTWQHSTACDAARMLMGCDMVAPFALQATLEVHGEIGRLTVTSNRAIFGPQPFLAIKTLDQRYLNDNLDCGTDTCTWHYTFDLHTVPLKAVDAVGVAANSIEGTTSVVVVDASGRPLS